MGDAEPDNPEDRQYDVPFSVDSALLKQLGERLVGRPGVALAELVKNSYDADATIVRIHVGADAIRVEDNGLGMSEEDFKAFWMRVGSPHKERLRESKRFHRPLTGSKGVGRLAAQFLGSTVDLRSTAKDAPVKEIRSHVDWAKARSAGSLTEATAQVRVATPRRTYTGDSPHGTVVEIGGLRQSWSAEEIQTLARELWMLQPPIELLERSTDRKGPKSEGFRLDLTSDHEELTSAFNRQMESALGRWEARIVGRFSRTESTGKVDVAVSFSDGTRHHRRFPLLDEGQFPERVIAEPQIDRVEYEIRVFRLVGRQGSGLKVGHARDYFKDYGGVYVYDAGFRLPYYGVETDWLGIESDHARRFSISRLLPEELHVDRAMNFLPTNRRLFGVVGVNTALESVAYPGPNDQPLAISVTRDRLVDGPALTQLRQITRLGLDFYATLAASRAAEQRAEQGKVAPLALSRLEETLDRVFAQAGAGISEELRAEAYKDVRAVAGLAKEMAQAAASPRVISLLGPLATAGIAALAYDHELVKQFHSLSTLATKLDSGAHSDDKAAAQEIRNWLDRARKTRKLFMHLGSQSDREEVKRFPAATLLPSLAERSEFLLRGIAVDCSTMNPEVLLPPATFAEWAAVFQNVLVNAANALVDVDDAQIVVSTSFDGRKVSLRVQDNGMGVDLRKAADFFRPFVRGASISAQRQEEGLGGTGLGLAIVQLIAESRSASVRFVQPTEGFATAFELSWEERPPAR